MCKGKDYFMDKESICDMIQAGRYNPAQVIVYQGIEYKIGAGYRDEVSVFIDADMLYILSLNTDLDYIGLDAAEIGYPDTIETVCFIDGSWNVEELFGLDWYDLHPEFIVEELEYLFAG
jgi:hypothetical protein